MHAPNPDTGYPPTPPRPRQYVRIHDTHVRNVNAWPDAADASTALARVLMVYAYMYMYVYVYVRVFMYTSIHARTHPGRMPADATTALTRPLMPRCSWAKKNCFLQKKKLHRL